MEVIILVGLPGSGKSTLASKYKKYIIINQDTIGDRHKCLELFKKSLSENKNVIIDRCNINRMQRNLWITVAKQYNVSEINCVNLIIDPELAIKRVTERKNHPTIKEETSIDKVRQIIYNFISTYECPELIEGFDEIIHKRVIE